MTMHSLGWAPPLRSKVVVALCCDVESGQRKWCVPLLWAHEHFKAPDTVLKLQRFKLYFDDPHLHQQSPAPSSTRLSTTKIASQTYFESFKADHPLINPCPWLPNEDISIDPQTGPVVFLKSSVPSISIFLTFSFLPRRVNQARMVR